MQRDTGDIVYVNCLIGNSTQDDIPGSYDVTYDTVLIDDPQRYFLSIMKFSIPLQNVPILIMPIIPNQGNPNLSTIRVGIRFGGVDFFENVIWIPQDTYHTGTGFIPVQNQSNQVITPYYYIWSYDHFAELISNALNTAWIAAGSPGGGAIPPYFYWSTDATDWRFTMPQVFYDSGAEIIYDVNFGSLVPAFHSTQYGKGIYSLTVVLSGGLQAAPNDVSPAYTNPAVKYLDDVLVIKPSYTALDYFSSIRKLLITSSAIPAQREYYPTQGSTSQLGLSNTLGILADFQIDVANVAGAQSGIALFDADQPRLINFASTSPIRKIDLQLFWVDRLNNIIPLTIPPLQTASVKLAFFDKLLYKHPKVEY